MADPVPLEWGHRFLMCRPTYFSVAYEINPWMHTDVVVDPDRAMQQWERLRETLTSAGATVVELEPVDGLPDLVFTANAGLVDGGRFVPSHFRNVERQGESPVNQAWFEQHGFDVAPLPADEVHEGAGDALPFTDPNGDVVLVSGYRMRSGAHAHAAISELLGIAVRPVELVDQRLYHLDLTFCPLDSRRAIVVPDAWDRYGARMMSELIPEPLAITADEAMQFVANSVVVGNVVVMPHCPLAVGRQLQTWGFDVEIVDVSEFQKAGGACRCLTLALDTSLSSGPTLEA